MAALFFKYQKREPSGAEQTTETETVYSNKHDNFLQLSSPLFNIHKEGNHFPVYYST